MADLKMFAWPASRLGEALEGLTGAAGLPRRAGASLNPDTGMLWHDDEALGLWLQAAAGHLGIEAEPLRIAYGEFEAGLREAMPALLRLPGDGELYFLALLWVGRRHVSLFAPDLAIHRLKSPRISAALRRDLEAPLLDAVDRLLLEAGVPTRRQLRARQAILHEQLGQRPMASCWRLRLAIGASFWHQALQARLLWHLVALVGGYAVHYLLWLLAWWVIGQAALQGRLDHGWLLAWALLLATLVPFRLLATWAQGKFAIGAGGLLKRRLLAGALRLEPEEIRHQGAGQFLGRVLEAEAVEALALSGGLLGVVAGMEILIAAAVLGAGAACWAHALLLLTWVAVALLLGWRDYRQRRHWTAERLTLTHGLVERLVGYRTLLAQEARECWHDGEDQELARYLADSAALDWNTSRLTVVVPRGWLCLGLLGLAPAFVNGHGSPVLLAIGLGGVFLAYRAFHKLGAALSHLAGTVIAWEQVAPLFNAAARPVVGGSPVFALPSAFGADHADGAGPILEMHELVFRYRSMPVLRGCNLRIRAGDRLLLEGGSGGGKSTLAAILSGLRVPESGLLLLRGLDRATLGVEGWRRRVAAAPQFHENHVFAETFAFNLVMGRRWPPRPTDVEAAASLCCELGLDDLLARMPAGLWQMVGDTGWQLSHGERSRLYIARALLQGADLVILDESFAALDPETLQRCLQCVLKRAATVLVIAHP